MFKQNRVLYDILDHIVHIRPISIICAKLISDAESDRPPPGGASSGSWDSGVIGSGEPTIRSWVQHWVARAWII